MKDKEWLKINLESVLYSAELSGLFSTGVTSSVNIVYDDILNLINQLEEPEITKEQAWKVIKETEQEGHFDAEMFYQDMRKIFRATTFTEPVSDLVEQYVLVPKSSVKETEPLVIPQFVAEWIKARKNAECSFIWSLTESAFRGNILEWLREDRGLEVDREKLLIDAWFSNNYLVKKDPQYCIKVGSMYLKKGRKDANGLHSIELVPNKADAFVYRHGLDPKVQINDFGGTIEEWDE